MARKAAKKDPARGFAVAAARVAHDDNCQNIVVLDLRGVSPVTDYFIIATGTSDRQLRSVADHVEEEGRKVGQRVWRVAGRDSADWICMDFVDVVVHLFDQTHRRYYDLELIWGEAPRVSWRRRAARRPKAPDAGPA